MAKARNGANTIPGVNLRHAATGEHDHGMEDHEDPSRAWRGSNSSIRSRNSNGDADSDFGVLALDDEDGGEGTRSVFSFVFGFLTDEGVDTRLTSIDEFRVLSRL